MIRYRTYRHEDYANKRWDCQKKGLGDNAAHLPILLRCKTNGAVKAVGALLRNWQLGASLPITVRDGAVTLKGPHSMGGGRIFLLTSAPLSLKVVGNEKVGGSGRWQIIRMYL